MKPAAKDFMLMWDNAYCVHEFEGEFVPFEDILTLCREAGNPDMVFEFASTSKITFPGAGISVMGCSEANQAYMQKLMGIQMISYDKESGQGELALNPYYKGNYEGVKPVIDTITLVPVLPETMIDQLKSSEVGLLNKCVDGQVILDGMALTADGFGMKNYARIGYGFCFVLGLIPRLL